VSVEDVADELYGLPPEDFTAARTAAAKQHKADAKEIIALRRPTVGAWLVNMLVRSEADLLDQLLALGPALAEAQQAGRGDVLRELGDQRRQLIGAVTDQAFAAVDRSPTAAARAEVESTLEAALADPSSAEAVRSGRLTRALSYAGFGGVDLEGAVAVASTTRKPQPQKKPAKDTAAAEQRALEAQGALDDAVRACQAAQEQQEAAEKTEATATEAVKAAEQALHEAREQRTAAEAETRRARHRTDQASKAVEDAQKRAEKARAALDKLRRAE
jgi:hypothetical protein